MSTFFFIAKAPSLLFESDNEKNGLWLIYDSIEITGEIYERMNAYIYLPLVRIFRILQKALFIIDMSQRL